MTRQQQHEGWLETAQLYNAGTPVHVICRSLGKTRTAVYKALRACGVEANRVEKKPLQTPDLTRHINEKRLAYARLLESHPEKKPTLSRLGLTKSNVQALDELLSPLGLRVSYRNPPSLKTIIGTKFYTLTWSEVFSIHSAPREFLQANSEAIRNGWQKEEN
jgi:hypothetical protein